MKRIFSSPYFLGIYSGCLTAVVLIVAISGFAEIHRARTFDEITVHRINIVEPDGTLRLVLTNSGSAPGLYIKNKEYPHPDRKSGGLLFFDDEGTEDGGLVYGLSKDRSGRVVGNNVHLSFDQYMQDQIFTVDAGRDGRQTYSELTMQDRGDYSILDAIDTGSRISSLPEEQREAERRKFKVAHPGDQKRVVLGRSADGASVLRLKDPEGRDRIVMQVAPDGTPKLQLLDADGKVLSELPPARR